MAQYEIGEYFIQRFYSRQPVVLNTPVRPGEISGEWIGAYILTFGIEQWNCVGILVGICGNKRGNQYFLSIPRIPEIISVCSFYLAVWVKFTKPFRQNNSVILKFFKCSANNVRV